MASVDEFLKSRRLGPIASGMSQDEIRELLGEPESVSVQKHPRIWTFGSLQLGFSNLPDAANPFLISMTLYFHDPDEHAPDVLALTGWMPSGNTTYEEFRAHLDPGGISVVGGVASGPRQHLVLESAVRVTFDEGRLYSIGYTAKREPEYKQVTVKVRRKDLDLIHRWAKGRHISASDLCSEWIREQVSQLEKMETS